METDTSAMGGRYKVSAGLRTGRDVYHGLDIFCAAVHLDSEDELSDASNDAATTVSSHSSNATTKSSSTRNRVKKWFSSKTALKT